MKYNVTDTCVTIYESCKISKKDFGACLRTIAGKYPDNPVLVNRSEFSLKMEWATHNFLYSLGLWKDRTKDVDLDYPCDKPEWVYKILGCLCWIFIR